MGGHHLDGNTNSIAGTYKGCETSEGTLLSTQSNSRSPWLQVSTVIKRYIRPNNPGIFDLGSFYTLIRPMRKALPTSNTFQIHARRSTDMTSEPLSSANYVGRRGVAPHDTHAAPRHNQSEVLTSDSVRHEPYPVSGSKGWAKAADQQRVGTRGFVEDEEGGGVVCVTVMPLRSWEMVGEEEEEEKKGVREYY